jgi:hypothetical protein
VAADISSNARHPLMGEATKQRAETLADELTRRGIQFAPIEWPADAQASASGRKTHWHATLWRRIVSGEWRLT